MTLDERLKKLRKSKGITQRDLAEAINVSVQSIHKWENGKGLPDAINLLNIASFYKVSLDFLMGHEVTNDLKNSKKGAFEKIKKYIKFRLFNF